MKWIADDTGRFKLRPYYATQEIDSTCNELVTKFLIKKYGRAKMPLQSGDLELIVEENVSEFDQYADLGLEGKDIEGVTYFHKNRPPTVKISEALSKHFSQENRRRTTIAHELGHVIFHTDLFISDFLIVDNEDTTDHLVRCNRQNILAPQEGNWLEWQAFYAGGAFLMPIFHMQAIADGVFDLVKHSGPFYIDSSAGRGFLTRVTQSCLISSAAATVRLVQLGYVTCDQDLAITY